MQRMWAPWRMAYIMDSKPGPGCFLCDLFAAHADREHLVLRRGRLCGVVMNRYPYNNGHLMIAPYRHVADVADLTREERAEMMDWLAIAVGCLREAMRPEGFNSGINLGAVAGAGLKDHVHMHLVPRWGGDTNFMAVVGEVKVIPQMLDDLWVQLQPLFAARSLPAAD